jgi:MFS family permease
MEPWRNALMVGLMFVLPQVAGYIASRVGRRASAARWPLTAAGVIGLMGVLAAISAHHTEEHARATGGLRGEASLVGLLAVALMVLHFTVGTILGVLDRRAWAMR